MATDPARPRELLRPLLPRLEELRATLHRHPSLSGEEGPTAERLREWLAAQRPAEVVTGLGGAGIAAVFEGCEPGPTVLLRAELDALPIHEPPATPGRSVVDGVSHKCGHDGHMTVLAGVGALLRRAPPRRGRVVLLFQPAEEVGTGARAVRDDPRFEPIAPDHAFALHNLPGLPEGCVAVRPGLFAAASEGLLARLTGRSAHASEPHLGRSPALALSQAIQSILALPAQHLPMDASAAVAITHARLGEPTFGISPGAGELRCTLRAGSDPERDRLISAAEEAVARIAASQGLSVEVTRHDRFGATVNDGGAARIVERAARDAGLEVRSLDRPFPWSEDFGELLHRCPGALFGLGSGPSCPPLHSESYVFPDAILEPGVLAMYSVATAVLDGADGAAP